MTFNPNITQHYDTQHNDNQQDTQQHSKKYFVESHNLMQRADCQNDEKVSLGVVASR
jgi:hypothetical protein